MDFKPSQPDFSKLEEYKNSPFFEERPTVNAGTFN
jgi:hypothetical protein